ncbi:MAG: molybdopterin-dependent oxidoreductase [Chloroflexota bacterium]|nr:molybdopterin-dependent oxidoreductase [Chloroflexota bacterium]
MKKTLLLLVVLSLLAVLPACAQKPPVPQGEVVLTVKGDITVKNVGDEYQFDLDMIKKEGKDLKTNDPWLETEFTYTGLPLSRLVEIVKPGGGATTLKLVAVDGYSAEVKIADCKGTDIVLAYAADGEDLPPEMGGPLKLAFADSLSDTYPPETWAWMVVEVTVE